MGMDKLKVAVAHPGKIGDALYSIPTIRYLAKTFDTKIDFYTSEHCKPALDLFEYQKEIDHAYIPPNYTIESKNRGVQPWKMPIAILEYEKTYQLGFRKVPDTNLVDFIARSAGVSTTEALPIYYEYPQIPDVFRNMLPKNPYIVLASRGGGHFISIFKEIIKNIPKEIDIAQIGGKRDFIQYTERETINMTNISLLYTLPILAGAIGFVGILSANLVLANGFDIPKVAIVGEKGWDKRHVIRSKNNFYLVNPTPKEVFKCLKI